VHVKFLSLDTFGIWGLLCVVLDIWNTKTRNPKVLVPYPLTFHNLGIVVCCGWHLKPLNPETRNPKVFVPHPFTFMNSGIVVCYGLTFETPKHEILKCWFHNLSPFGIRELLCVVVRHLKPQIPKSWNVSSTFFSFAISGVVVFCRLTFETP